eukprot:CAMPEP_0178439630 /NCGR_PEP_ID=MMETSP0689_2-20121128/36266_1 /TAXON_ID=160604 /ORGANISM="Amphidinium massartii, Strain CS-259" /LENGTH=30 /DNA_ID= /DNA_START= /DNA_END= /DNA_ORIENTATION=
MKKCAAIALGVIAFGAREGAAFVQPGAAPA